MSTIPLKPARWRTPVVIQSNAFTPSMSLPTSTPQQAAPVNQRRLKFRASCDACAASKVKCSKAHPVCARCSANNSQCVYGVSRKHGKPGRTKKRNLDGTPFIKAPKRRPSPDKSEFTEYKYTAQPERTLPRTDLEMGSNWASDWSSTTPSLPATPSYDVEATPEPFYADFNPSEVGFVGTAFLPTAQLGPGSSQDVQSDSLFREPFAKPPSEQLRSPELQVRDGYMNTNAVKPPDYIFNNTMTTAQPHSFSSSSTLHVPTSQSMGTYEPVPYLASFSKPTPHCCYTLAYSTLESLGMMNTDALTQESLASGLSTARLAVDAVLQLLRCPCSSDPHLAMLYSSITSRILTWYQVASGVNGAIPTNSPVPSSGPAYTPASTQAMFSSPLLGTGSNGSMNYPLQKMHLQRYDRDELEYQKHRIQIVLYEVRNCEQLVEALVSWKGNGSTCEQAEFLYDMLGAWLRAQLYNTVEYMKRVDIPCI